MNFFYCESLESNTVSSSKQFSITTYIKVPCTHEFWAFTINISTAKRMHHHMLRIMTFMHCQFQTVGVIAAVWFKEQTVWLWTLLLIPSPTGSHPARGESGVCMCIHICLVWSVFLTAFIVPHHCHMDVEWELLSAKLYPYMGSNPGCQIFNLQRYFFSVSTYYTSAHSAKHENAFTVYREFFAWV